MKNTLRLSWSRVWGLPRHPYLAVLGAGLALLLAAGPASAQLTRSTATFNVFPLLPAGQEVRATDVAFDATNQVYLHVMAFGVVWGVFVDVAGNPVGAAFQIGSSSAACPFAQYPRVEYGQESGGFLVTWHQQSSCPNGGNVVYAAKVAYPGSVSPARLLSASFTNSTQGPAIAYSRASRRFIVAWTATTTAIEIIGVDDAGVPVTAPAPAVPSGAQNPALAWNSTTDEFGLAYAGYNNSSAFVGFKRLGVSSGATLSSSTFGVSAGTFNPDVDYNPATGNYVMGWSIGAGSNGAEIDSSGNVIATGLISSLLGTPTSFNAQFNPLSGTFLAISEHDSLQVIGLELSGRGSPISTATLVTAGATAGSYNPRTTSRPDSKQWAISFSTNYNQFTGQIVATASSNGGGNAPFGSPGGGGSGGTGGSGPFALTITPPTGGTIVTAGIYCGAGGSLCSTVYSTGFSVALSAVPAAGYTFGGWTGDCAPSGTTTMTQNRSCSATFTSTSGGGSPGGSTGGSGPFTLTIAKPTGGTIVTAGITCGVGGSACVATYSSGFPVALTATPATGYTFGGWTGDCAPSGTTTMTQNRSCSAAFTSTSGGGSPGGSTGGSGPFTLTIAKPTGGTIVTAGITCGVGGSACVATYSSGFPVALTATPATGYTFGGWTGDCAPSGTTTMTQNRSCSAAFTSTSGGGSPGGSTGGSGPFTLTIAKPTGGTIVTAGITCGVGGSACVATYSSGFPVALTATPAAGYTFSGWTGDCAPAGTTTMTQNRSCSAAFTSTSGGSTPPPTTTTASPNGDFDRNGKSDLLFQNTSGQLLRWSMTGTQLSLEAIMSTATASPALRVVATGDLTGDGNADVLWQNTTNGHVFLNIMHGTTLISQQAIQGSDTPWRVVGTADMNRDSHIDILWHNPADGRIWVWFMRPQAGSSGFPIAGHAGAGNTPSNGFIVLGGNAASSGDPNWTVGGIGDFNADGVLDMAWQHADGRLRVWYLNGTSLYYDAVLTTVAAGWRLAVIGDVIGDAKIDVVWQNTGTGALAFYTYSYNPTVLTKLLEIAAPANSAAWQLVGPR